MGKGNILSELKRLRKYGYYKHALIGTLEMAKNAVFTISIFANSNTSSSFCPMAKIISISRKSYFVHEIYLIPLGKLTPPMRKT